MLNRINLTMANVNTRYSASLFLFIINFIQYKQLIWQFTCREIFTRYKGSGMGLMWSILNPVITLLMYTIFFSVFLQARWNILEENHVNYALILFVGLILNGLFSECINRAPGLIVQHANYVKKVVTPLELFPAIAVLSALFHLAVNCIVLLCAQLLLNHWIAWTLIFFPVILLPFIVLILGLTWFLAALGVYVRDLTQITSSITMITLFMSPVFYPRSNLPEHVQPWLVLNPLTFIVEQSRNVFFYAQPPDWSGLMIYSVISIVIAWSGFWWFQKTREGFADVL